MKKLCVSLLLIVLLAACDPADPVSGPDTPTPDTSAPVSDPMSGPDTPAPPLLSLSADMAAQYTIVYDDSDAAVVTMFEEFAASLRFKLKAELPLIPASEAETDYGHEIVLGNARPAAADVTDTLTKNDFASAVRDGDWFLCASDPIQYRYLFRVVSDRILTRNSKGVYTVNEDILFSESDLSETSIAEYLRKKSSALSPTVIRSITQACTYTAQDGTELLYRFYLPSDYTEDKEYPVVVFLHGAGDRGNDNDKQLSDMIDTLFNLGPSPYLDAILIIPQCPKEAQWVNTPWNKGNYSVANVPESAQLKAVMELLDTVEATYSVDKSRVYAMGVSMGGFGTWDLLMRHPDRFAAGMPLCGAADPAMAQAVKDIPIYTFHGSADTTVPVSGTRAMVDAVQAAGGKVLRYEELEGEGHLIQIPIFKRPEVSEWLFAQKKQ